MTYVYIQSKRFSKKKKKESKVFENEEFSKMKNFPVLYFFRRKINSFHDCYGKSCTEGSTARLVSISFPISLRTRASILHFPEKMRRPKGDTRFGKRDRSTASGNRWIR